MPAIGAKRIVDVSRADVARLHSSLRRMPRQANLVTSVRRNRRTRMTRERLGS
jgi:hypothetical protein